MKINIVGLDDMNDKDKQSLVHDIQRTLDGAELDEYSLTISFVDKKTMKSLNFQFKKKHQVTDVLSFPTPAMEKLFAHTKNMLGDVVICLDQAALQAKTLGHSLKEEIIVLSVHGLFHLLGYDHEISEVEANMQMQGEMYLLEKAGFAPELSLIGRV